MPKNQLEVFDAPMRYAASTGVFTPAATPNVVWRITGVSTAAGPVRIIRVLKIVLCALAGTAGEQVFFLSKFVTPNTGGTLVPSIGISLDTGKSPVPIADIGHYTVDPTAGVGADIMCLKAKVPTPTDALGQGIFTFDYTKNPVVIRGSSENLSLNLKDAALLAGLSLAVSCEWVESLND